MKIKDYKTEELVKILNKGLLEGKSGVITCKELGLARSSVLTRIKREGYVLKKDENKYVKENEEKPEIENVKQQIEKPKEKKTKVVEKKQRVEKTKTENKKVEEGMNEKEGEWKVEEAILKLKESLKNKAKAEVVKEKKEEAPKEIIKTEIVKEVVKVVNDEEVDEMKMLLKNLQKRIEKLESQEKVESKEKTITITNTKETTTRSIRLYKEVNDKFNKYLKKNKEKKVIDILSLAILEYINK